MVKRPPFHPPEYSATASTPCSARGPVHSVTGSMMCTNGSGMVWNAICISASARPNCHTFTLSLETFSNALTASTHHRAPALHLLCQRFETPPSTVTTAIYVASPWQSLSYYTRSLKKLIPKETNILISSTKISWAARDASRECSRDASCIATLKITTSASRKACTAGSAHHHFSEFHGREQLESSKDSMAGKRKRGRPPEYRWRPAGKR